MTVTVVGVPVTVGSVEWAKLMRRVQQAAGLEEWVCSGGAVTPGAGPRQVNVAALESLQAGTLAEADAEVKQLDTNTGTKSRIDTIVLEVAWSIGGVATNSANAGAIQVIKGSPGAPPLPFTLKRIPGDTWQTVLAYVTVDPGAGVLPSGKIKDARTPAPFKSWGTAVTVSDGGTAPQSVAVVFPPGLFTATPHVAFGPVTGASASTISNLSLSNRSKDGVTVTINRNTATAVFVDLVVTGP